MNRGFRSHGTEGRGEGEIASVDKKLYTFKKEGELKSGVQEHHKYFSLVMKNYLRWALPAILISRCSACFYQTRLTASRGRNKDTKENCTSNHHNDLPVLERNSTGKKGIQGERSKINRWGQQEILKSSSTAYYNQSDPHKKILIFGFTRLFTWFFTLISYMLQSNSKLDKWFAIAILTVWSHKGK